MSRAMMANRPARFATSNPLFANLEKNSGLQASVAVSGSGIHQGILKEWQRLTHSGCHVMVRLKEAMLLILNDAPLGPE